MMMPELHRPIPIDRISGADIEVQASPAECAALAKRLLLPAVGAVWCRWRCRALPGGVFAAEGRLKAELTQICVVSLDPFPAKVDERFEVHFVPEDQIGDPDPDEEIDEIPYQGFEIDLGEATAEQLALSLDPYPRKPGAVLPPEASDEPVHPFAALARLPPKSPPQNCESDVFPPVFACRGNSPLLDRAAHDFACKTASCWCRLDSLEGQSPHGRT